MSADDVLGALLAIMIVVGLFGGAAFCAWLLWEGLK